MIKSATPVKRTRSVAWPEFEATLSQALSALEEDQFLIINIKQTNRYVQFVGQGHYGLRVEAVSNNFLEKCDKLTRTQQGKLTKAGWQAPTGNRTQATPELDPDGSPNYFCEFDAPVACAQASSLAVSTLADILDVPHPGQLEYEAFDAQGNTLVFPSLGLRRVSRAQTPASSGTEADGGVALSLQERLCAAISKESGIADLALDKDDDVCVHYGDVGFVANVVGDPPCVRITAQLADGVAVSESLLERLNELNLHSQLLRFVWFNEAVWGSCHIPVAEFSDANVAQTMREAFPLAADMAKLLTADFSGKVPNALAMPSAARH